MTDIVISQLTKSFQMGEDTVHALQDLNVIIPEKSMTVAMGPSGSGKSTLLYILGGLERPTSGVIDVFGQRIDELNENDLALYRRNVVGFIFQSYNLVPSMTALENVALPLRFANVGRKQRLEIAAHLLDRVGLANRAHHRPRELSGGQQQRVAVARALVHQPKLILADEPTGNLDTGSGFAIMNLLSELHNDGSTILIVTHDPRMRSVATNLLYMIDGGAVDEAAYQAAMTFEHA